MPLQCTCQQCGATFFVKPSKVANGRGLYCSRSCLAKSKTGARNPRWSGGPVACTCQECGALFHKVPAAVALGEGKYCSRACQAAAQTRLIGPLAPSWKGGRHVTTAGYVIQPRADGRHVREHRAIMEQHLRRPLRADEHVHHINGDKADNRLENLQVLSPSEHSRLHNTGRTIDRWAKGYDACLDCGRSDTRHWAKGLCRSCYMKAWKRRGD